MKTAYEEIRPLVQKLYLLGLSMGRTPHMYSTIHFRVEGIITVNAAIAPPNFEKLYMDDSLAAYVEGVGSDIRKEGITEWAYSKTPKKWIGDILDLTKQVRKDLSKILCPTLLFKATEDHVIPPENQNYIYEDIGNPEKEIIELKNSYHVATLDNEQQLIINKQKNLLKAYNTPANRRNQKIYF